MCGQQAYLAVCAVTGVTGGEPVTGVEFRLLGPVEVLTRAVCFRLADDATTA